MMSRSRAGRRARRASREASAGVQSPLDSARGDPEVLEGSSMFRSRNLLNRVHEFAPVVALRSQDLPALAGQSIETAAPLARLLDPLADDPAPFLETVEERVERGDLELQPAAGPLLDQLADLVAVAGPGLDERQDQQLRAAFLQLPAQHRRYMLHSDI